MRAFCSPSGPLQAVRACQDPPVLSAWLQHMLSSSAVFSSCNSSSSTTSTNSEARRGLQTQSTASGEQPLGTEQQQLREGSAPQAAEANRWKHAQRYGFSIRPSVLSPLHALHREGEEIDARLKFLQTTMQAHLKLSEEVHPDELAAHAGSTDPVAAALASRRQKLAAVEEKFHHLLDSHLPPCADAQHMDGYYTILEASLKQKDADAVEFQKVLQGDRTVWDYWFQHFTPQYSGLPGLGSIEKIYNQVDDEVMMRQMGRLRTTAPKPLPEPKVDHLGRACAVGGRKTSVAQVFVWRGSGRILVNRKPLDAYFSDLLMRSAALRPLAVTGLMGQVDVLVQVDGGGVSGQAQAAAHGIAKALRRLDPAFKPALKAAGLLKRDPRMVERKKPGKAKARKSFTWVKR